MSRGRGNLPTIKNRVVTDTNKRKENTMTTREFLTNVTNRAISDEDIAFAQKAIEKLDARNAKRASTPSKTAIANAPIKANIVDCLRNGGKVASEIGVAVGISTNKASALCRQLVEDGRLTVAEVKIKGKGKVKSYSIAE